MSVKYRAEFRSELAPIEKEAARARSPFIRMAVYDQETQRMFKHRVASRFLVKGRPVGGGRLEWDVYALCGMDDPVLIAGGFAWQEEAMLFARDRKMGRQSVSFGGIRGLFKSTGSGISVPTKNVDLPGKTNVKVRETGSGVIVE